MNGQELLADYGLHEVMKAVEAAEATIKQQVDENNRLRDELHRKSWSWRNMVSRNQIFEDLNLFQNWMDLHADISSHSTQISDTRRMNGIVKGICSGQVLENSPGFSLLSSPFNSVSPARLHADADSCPILNSSSQGTMEVVEVNKPTSWKQGILKVRDHEEEISMLRKHLSDYSMKELQICNEKYILEKRIAHMRLAFDQQQQDIIEAASKAISYRQDIIEENIRLTYALQSCSLPRKKNQHLLHRYCPCLMNIHYNPLSQMLSLLSAISRFYLNI